MSEELVALSTELKRLATSLTRARSRARRISINEIARRSLAIADEHLTKAASLISADVASTEDDDSIDEEEATLEARMRARVAELASLQESPGDSSSSQPQEADDR